VDIEKRVQVSDGSAASWLDWLSKEHGSGFPKIRAQVEGVMKKRVQNMSMWNDLTEEQRSWLGAAVFGPGSAGSS
jgi:hypothetical protein